jgi:17 kDa outer membrane surface antigen
VYLRSNPTAIHNHTTYSSDWDCGDGRDRRPACLGAGARGRLAIAAFGLLAFSLGGCSISIPLGRFMDDDATGSIKAAASPLSPDLDMKDWRIAEPILARALQSGEPAAPARWANPDSGRSGAFQPVAGAFPREGKPCRAFVARIVVAEGSKMLQAVGCPDEAGAVAIDKVEPWKGI